ncbi:FCS-Like Zinc finger 16-like [Andrographis paniculata]|uniref:FCS-Like Zinc finger 16-like n=1 Tax=Andrographis paniculata TaxID=175694 RepID=UPI0021E8CAFA|nr:FCS-Like Zinc finger 16-like [Andrographis paniculata]
MPVKRSRPENSSSRPVLSPTYAVCPMKIMRTDAAAEPSRPSILDVASVVSVGGCDQTKIGEFLERCHYCKKRIAQNSEVFMYSNLCAFCSPECRDFQISLDHSAEKQPNISKGKCPPGKGFHNVKDQ